MRVAWPVIIAACACGARADLSSAGLVWSVSPQHVEVTQGGAGVALSIHIENAFDEDVSVDAPSMPLELSAASITIPAGVHDATMSIRASREAEQGEAGAVSIRSR